MTWLMPTFFIAKPLNSPKNHGSRGVFRAIAAAIVIDSVLLTTVGIRAPE
jgi:hypothetical protein